MPSIITLVLSVMTVTYLFLEPGRSWTVSSGSVVLADLLFTVTGGIIVASAEALRRSRRRVEGALLELSRQRGSLELEVNQRMRAESELRRQRDWFDITLSSIADAVIATDLQNKIVFMNWVAESLTGWTSTDAKDQPLNEVFRILDENTSVPLELSIQVSGARNAVGRDLEQGDLDRPGWNPKEHRRQRGADSSARQGGGRNRHHLP